jgi:hypothetical protein
MRKPRIHRVRFRLPLAAYRVLAEKVAKLGGKPSRELDPPPASGEVEIVIELNHVAFLRLDAEVARRRAAGSPRASRSEVVTELLLYGGLLRSEEEPNAQ